MSLPPPRVSSGPRVIVVGAGAVGSFCAMTLAERGAAVTLVDADARFVGGEPAPRAASAAAAGMLGAYSETLYEGASTHRLLPKLCEAGLAAWDKARAETPDLNAAVRDTGALLLAHGDADMARLMRVRDRALRADVGAIWSDALPGDLDPHLYSLRVRGALRLPMESVVDVGPMLELLHERLALLGGSILRGRAVSRLATPNGAVRGVAFEDGSGLVADAVVLATGALAASELTDAAPAFQQITPAKGVLGVVEPEQAALLQETVRTLSVYATPGRFGEIYFGSTMELGRTDLDSDLAAIDTLFAALRRALPGARFEGPPRFHAAGLRAMSPDWAPLIGPSGPPGCFVACGHGRNGWLLAPLTADMVAAQVLGAPLEDLWGAFRPDRFEKKAA